MEEFYLYTVKWTNLDNTKIHLKNLSFAANLKLKK